MKARQKFKKRKENITLLTSDWFGHLSDQQRNLKSHFLQQRGDEAEEEVAVVNLR